MTRKQGLKTGLVVSGILLGLIFLGILIYGLTSYEGYCISFEPPKRECNILEFIFPYLLLLAVYSVFGKPVLALILVLIILIPPMVGYLLGKRK
jgi:hypothetical protein